ncbi:MAG: sigma-70 family RNA polymerase sigma factor, partial [Cellulomonas sp.]|nr:sigma-70 family RNA polymerase sigma factor [Cellulomonas sp.]
MSVVTWNERGLWAQGDAGFRRFTLAEECETLVLDIPGVSEGGVEAGRGTGMDLRSDADLIMAARSGDAGSFGVLYERHAGAALIVARQYTSGKAEAEDAVADAFAAVWSALRGGSGPTDAFRAYLFTVVRRAAAVQRERGRRADPTDDVAVLESGTVSVAAAEEPALEGFERSIVARAFASLPERCQAVLWHSEIE